MESCVAEIHNQVEQSIATILVAPATPVIILPPHTEGLGVPVPPLFTSKEEILMGSTEHYRSLPVHLTDEEKERLTQDLIRRLDVIEDIEDRRKASNDEYKSQIKRESVNCGQLRRDLKNGYRMEEVKCEETMDWENGVVVTKRTDTYEVVSEREITEAERQMRLEDAKPRDEEEGDVVDADFEPQTTEEQIEKDEADQTPKKKQIFTKDKSGKKEDEPEDT